MSLLERIVQVDGVEETVQALILRYVGHMYWPIGDLARSDKRLPSEAKLADAARQIQTAAPTQVGLTAAWFDLLGVLSENGLGAAEQLTVLVEVLRGDFKGGMLPGPDVVARVVAGLGADEVRPFVQALDAEPVRRNPLYTLVCALPLVKAGQPPPAAIDQARLFRVSPGVLRSLLEALDPAVRERALLRCMQTDSDNAARVVLENLAFMLDLLDTPALQAALKKLREVSATYPGVAKVHAMLDSGGATLDADGLSAMARGSLDYWLYFLDAVRKEEDARPLAERAAGVRLAVPGAAELADVAAWAAASNERRLAIAQAVLVVLGEKRFALVGVETFADLPIAVFQHRRQKTRLHLLPGGAFQRGLSEAEEAKIRDKAAAAGLTDTYEEFGQLIEQIPHMRPVRRVSVGPMLVGRDPGFELEPSELSDWLGEGPWRLPTEAEWEYSARGGQPEQLTYRGDDLPLEDWFKESGRLAEKAANRFGLWGFGLEPEVCADCWKATYENAPTDGSPATGQGPRVVRGGAAQIYPWQGCGEWQLLLTAMRTNQQAWDYVVFARPVIGLAPSLRPASGRKAYSRPQLRTRPAA